MKPLRVLIAISVIAVVLVAGFFYFRHADPEQVFSRGLASAVRSGLPTVHLRNISSPAWERLYIFGPYTPPDRISAALGFAWTSPAADTIRSSDGVNLLVFVTQQRVVMSVLHPRNEGDFVPDAVGYNYLRDDAEFAIVRRPQDNWLLLGPVPNTRKAPNHALQRTAPRVTLAAAHHPAAFAHPAPAMSPQPARRAPQSLSLGSFGDITRVR